MNCPVCQCQFGSSDCVHASGDGSSSPYRPGVKVASGVENMAQCGPEGLGTFLRQPWANIPSVNAYNTVTQTVQGGVVQVAFFNASNFDTDSMHDPQEENSRITFNTPGLYVVTLSLTIVRNPPPSGVRFVIGAIRKNGSVTVAVERGTSREPSGPLSVSVGVQREFQRGDYVEALFGGSQVVFGPIVFDPDSLVILQTDPPATFAATFLRELAP